MTFRGAHKFQELQLNEGMLLLTIREVPVLKDTCSPGHSSPRHETVGGPGSCGALAQCQCCQSQT